MKKILLLSLGVLFFAGLVSCKKDYTCECSVASSTGTVDYSIEIPNQTKKKAKDACQALESTYTISGFTTSVSCKLK